MQPTHFMDIVIKDGAIIYQLYARLLFIAHQMATGEVPTPCAIDFPGYHRQNGLGFKARVFASGDVLEAFRLKASPLLNVNLIEAQPIRRVPDNIERYVQSRSIKEAALQSKSTKPTPSWMRREMARHARRGESEVSEEVVRERWRKRALRSKVKSAPFVPMHSFSSQRSFSLYIDRQSVSADAPMRAGAGYGLGYVVPDIDATGEDAHAISRM